MASAVSELSVNVRLWDELAPTIVFPNVRLAGESVATIGDGATGELPPPQLARQIAAQGRSQNNARIHAFCVARKFRPKLCVAT